MNLLGNKYAKHSVISHSRLIKDGYAETGAADDTFSSTLPFFHVRAWTATLFGVKKN